MLAEYVNCATRLVSLLLLSLQEGRQATVTIASILSKDLPFGFGALGT